MVDWIHRTVAERHRRRAEFAPGLSTPAMAKARAVTAGGDAGADQGSGHEAAVLILKKHLAETIFTAVNAIAKVAFFFPPLDLLAHGWVFFFFLSALSPSPL